MNADPKSSPARGRRLVGSAIGAVGLALGLLVPAGCEGLNHVVTSLKPTGTPVTYTGELREYPVEIARGADLDVLVIRVDRKSVRLDNRTARPLDGVQVWLNSEYGATISNVPIGRGPEIPLTTFVNHFGERYPIGSFLEPEKTLVVTQAEVLVDQQMRPLVVELPETWQDEP